MPARRQNQRLMCLLGQGLYWLIASVTLVILAHTGAIAGWVMHIGTVILTFRFALRLGSCLR